MVKGKPVCDYKLLWPWRKFTSGFVTTEGKKSLGKILGDVNVVV